MMRAVDVLAFSTRALTEGRHRVRTMLIVLAMAIGVGGVVSLSWLGDAARAYIVGEFQALGTDLLIVLPGRSETTGGAPPMFGDTPRDLTLADSQALERIAELERIAPIVVGGAFVEVGRLSRECVVIGSTPVFFAVRNLDFAAGSAWEGEVDRAQAVCVLGAKIRQELFGEERALGAWVRVGDRRYRVVGVCATEGRSIGLDLEELVVVPVASAQALFDSPGLFRILAEVRDHTLIGRAEEGILDVIRQRHDGESDVTVISQEAVLSTFDSILFVLTAAVAGIAAISLLVAGVLIMNVMIVAVSQRREEIGLLQALGSSPRQIGRLFLVEATMLSLTGALAGLCLGQLVSWLGHWAFPELRAGAPWWALALSAAVAVLCGVLFGVAPARQAAALDPVEALSGRS